MTELKTELGSEKLILRVLKGEKTAEVPLWFMRQAGRYLPEYRELRAKKKGFMAMAMDPEAASEITIQPIRRFNMDAAIIFSDILVVPYALGQRLDFEPGKGPVLDAVKDTSGLSALNFSQFKSLLDPVYEAINKTRLQLNNEGFQNTALIGFAGAPWTVATYMVEGGSSRDFIAVKEMAYRDPEMFSEMIDMLVKATADHLIEQVDAGAEVLQIFDSWAGILDEDQFERWVIGPTKKIIETVKKACPDTPIIGFPRGAGQSYLSYLQQTGVDAVSLDSRTSTRWAADNLQTHVPVQGNLDPICLKAGGEALKTSVRRIIDDLSGGPFVFNLGHGIHKDTPVEHVEQLIELVRNYK